MAQRRDNDDDNDDHHHHHAEITRIGGILADLVTYKTLLSLIDGPPKAVVQICTENNTPLSSTYKAVKRLQQAGLAHVHRYINVGPSRSACTKAMSSQ